MIRIRLKRIGKKRHPHYRVVVADKPDKRDGRFIENLGSYDPHADPPSIVHTSCKDVHHRRPRSEGEHRGRSEKDQPFIRYWHRRLPP